MLTTAELSAMRTAQLGTLVQSATWTRKTKTSDGAGGWSESATTVGTLAVRVTMATEREAALVAGRADNQLLVRITTVAGSDVRIGDLLAVDGKSYRVLAAPVARTFETARQLLCDLV